MRDFNWTDALWAVINDDGTFAGRPCLTYEEARELAAQDPKRHIYKLDWRIKPEMRSLYERN